MLSLAPICLFPSFPPSCRSACHGEAKVTLVDRSCVPATRTTTHQGQWLGDGCLREWRLRHVARGINLSGWENVRCTALRLQTAKNGHALRAPADRLMLFFYFYFFILRIHGSQWRAALSIYRDVWTACFIRTHGRVSFCLGMAHDRKSE